MKKVIDNSLKRKWQVTFETMKVVIMGISFTSEVFLFISPSLNCHVVYVKFVNMFVILDVANKPGKACLIYSFLFFFSLWTRLGKNVRISITCPLHSTQWRLRLCLCVLG